MRNRIVLIGVLAGAGLAGYVGAGRSVHAQGAVFTIETGQRILLTYDREHSVSCDVASVSGDWVLCRSGRRDESVFSRPRPDDWYNVRVARGITKYNRE